MRFYKKKNGKVDTLVLALLLSAVVSSLVVGSIAWSNLPQYVSPPTVPSGVYCAGVFHDVSVTMDPPRYGGNQNVALHLSGFDRCFVDVRYGQTGAKVNQLVTYTGVEVVEGLATVLIHYDCNVSYTFQFNDDGSSATASTVFC